LIPRYALPQEQSNTEQTSVTKQDVSGSAPDLADIIPKATKLSADLAALKNKVTNAPDISEFDKKVDGIEDNLKDPASQLQQIKEAKGGRLNKLVELRKVIEQENKLCRIRHFNGSIQHLVVRPF
jgi:septal ring factor EnvC (AmiA/AmiB activator)